MKEPRFHLRRITEIRALQAFGIADEEVIESLIALTDYEESITRRTAYHALAALGASRPEPWSILSPARRM